MQHTITESEIIGARAYDMASKTAQDFVRLLCDLGIQVGVAPVDMDYAVVLVNGGVPVGLEERN